MFQMLIFVHICTFALINKKWGQNPEIHTPLKLINYSFSLSICTLFLLYLFELGHEHFVFSA